MAFGEVQVGLENIEPIRQLAATALLLAARAPRIDISSDSDSMRYAFYFRPMDEFAEGYIDRFVAVALTHYRVPDCWRMTLGVRTFMSEERHSNKRVCYRFEASGQELLEAKKEVFLVIGNSTIETDELGNPYETVTTDRKMYEKPMTTEDCDKVIDVLGQTVSRALIA